MRDPKRINRILKLLEKAWDIEPDLRLGQLVSILAYSVQKPAAEPFYAEDDKMEQALIDFISENK
jgi:uncharacterized protein YihD (DUF1040 family)